MSAANVATPKYFSWYADKTLDVSKVSAEEINPQVYTIYNEQVAGDRAHCALVSAFGVY